MLFSNCVRLPSSESSTTKWCGRAANHDGGLDDGLDPGGDVAGEYEWRRFTVPSVSSSGTGGVFVCGVSRVPVERLPNITGLKLTNSQSAGTPLAALSSFFLSEPTPAFPLVKAYFRRLIFVLKLDIRKLFSGVVNHIFTIHTINTDKQIGLISQLLFVLHSQVRELQRALLFKTVCRIN